MKNQIIATHTPARFFPATGGVETYVKDSVMALAKIDVESHVICANEPKSEYKNLSMKVTKLPYFGKIANTNITLTLPQALYNDKTQLIHSYMPTPWSADISAYIAKKRNIPFVLTYFNDITGSGIFNPIAKLYMKYQIPKILKMADKIIVTNQEYISRSQVLHNYSHKIIIIPIGIDTNRFFQNRKTAKKYDICFLSVLDSYHDYKGLDDLIQGIQLVKGVLPNIKVAIGGTGNKISFYQNQVNNLGLQNNIFFLGYVKNQDLSKFYQQSRIFILPSNSKEEGFGIAALEAMASEIPVICTNYVNVHREVKRLNLGIVIEPKNPLQISKAIKKLLLKDNLNEIGMKCRKNVLDKYSWTQVALQIKNIYQGLVYEK